MTRPSSSPKVKPPKTKREFALYRASVSCKLGIDAINDRAKCPYNTGPTEYALFNLLHAVKEIAEVLAMPDEPEGPARGKEKR